MFVGTHAALPVLIAASVELGRVAAGKRRVISTWGFVSLGVAGILPDLLSPHLSLHARLTSWTHNIWFLMGMLPPALILGRRMAGGLTMGVALWVALSLHLAADMITGGISPLFPWGERVGIRTIPFRFWWALDLFLVPSAVFLVYLVSRLDRRVQNRMSEDETRNWNSVGKPEPQ